MGLLLSHYRERIEYDLLSLGSGERVVYTGVVVAGLSSLGFGAGNVALGSLRCLQAC